VEQRLSAMQIARLAGCSHTTIEDHLQKMGIERRSISEAIYARRNPDGDPFKFRMPLTAEEWRLFGLGLGLYWGEGNKASKQMVRINNTDPRLLKAFMDFMEKFFCVKKEKLRLQIQIFDDIDIDEAIDFWTRELGVSREKFYQPIITKSDSIGTHNNKSRYGVVALVYSNIKLRNQLMGELSSLAQEYGDAVELTVPRDLFKYRPIAQKP
jgi:hypothetical protein